MANVLGFGAVGDGETDDTDAIQAALNAGGVTYLPPTGAQYRVRGLLLPSGAIVTGDGMGGFGAATPGSQESRIALFANVNGPMLRLPAGAANVRLRDLHLDGNRNNNATGDVIHLDDAATGEESGLHVDRVFVDAAAGNGIYVGTRRRAAKIRDSQVLYSGAAGIRINGSDAGIDTCVVGSSAGNGIEIAGSVCRVTNCDIFGHGGNGIEVLPGVNMVALVANGIDRNRRHGISVGDRAGAITITANLLHANSQAGHADHHHIAIGATEGTSVSGNTFGVDSDLPHRPAWCVHSGYDARIVMSANLMLPGAAANGLHPTDSA